MAPHLEGIQVRRPTCLFGLLGLSLGFLHSFDRSFSPSRGVLVLKVLVANIRLTSDRDRQPGFSSSVMVSKNLRWFRGIRCFMLSI